MYSQKPTNTYTFDEQVEVILGWFKKAQKEDQLAFKNLAKDDLIKYHHSLGMSIRNHFKLWESTWVPFIIDGVDHAPNHPDAISMRIIEAVWEKVQDMHV